LRTICNSHARANAARAFARNEGIDDRRGQLIWDGVALNSTPSVALYKAGIGLDWGAGAMTN
jgi:hypothetical protein